MHGTLVKAHYLTLLVLRKLLAVRRPAEYDASLQPSTDLHPESYAFPSLESYMSIVIIGHLMLHYKSLIFFLFGSLLIFVIGISRLHSKSRFFHQILGSWILGLLGLIFGFFTWTALKFPRLFI